MERCNALCTKEKKGYCHLCKALEERDRFLRPLHIFECIFKLTLILCITTSYWLIFFPFKTIAIILQHKIIIFLENLCNEKVSKATSNIHRPIWSIRLQLMWFTYAAVHAVAAQQGPKLQDWLRTPLSTLLILCSGWLVWAVLGHILIQTDLKNYRDILIVAFAALIINVTASIFFQDYPGTIISLLFAIIIGQVAWNGSEIGLKKLLLYRYTAFTAISLTSFITLFEFPFNIFCNYITVGKNNIAVGPTSTGAFGGFAIGILLKGRLLPSGLPYHNQIQKISLRNILFQTILFSFFFGFLVMMVINSEIQNKWNISSEESMFASFLIGVSVTFSIIGFFSLFLSYKCKSSVFLESFPSYHDLICLSLVGFLGGSLHGICVSLLRQYIAGSSKWITHVFLIEGPMGLIFGLSLFFSLRLARYIANSHLQILDIRKQII